MKEIEFVKMHGLGNDFILLDGVGAKLSRLAFQELAKSICDRKTGVGADGIILMLPSSKADLRMRIFNSDGSEAEMCGNGFRCLVRYIYDKRYISRKKIGAETPAGIITGEIISAKKDDFQVKVNMGKPEFEAAKIPVKTGKRFLIDESVRIDGQDFGITAVSMGNPHAVIFVDNFDFDWQQAGKKIENHRLFPQKTNVEFARILGRKKVMLRSWERGAGATLASGTGSAAAVAAGIKTGRLDRRIEVKVELGVLLVEMDKLTDLIYKSGPAEYICTGHYYF